MFKFQWLRAVSGSLALIVMILLTLFAGTRIFFLVGYGYEFLDYPHTGVLHEYYYMQPYVLELRILTNWLIVIGFFCYLLKLKSGLYIFAVVFLIKSLEVWMPSVFSGRVLFIPGEWAYKLVPTIFWLAVLLVVYFRLKSVDS